MKPKRRKPKGKTSFVPGVVFTTAIAGVVPACVVGCTSSSSGSPEGVAYCAYDNGNCATVAAVAYMAFDASDGDAPSEAQADVAVDAQQAGDATGDATGDAAGDTTMSVADAAFKGD